MFTVRDQAAGGICAVWPRQPFMAHWQIEDSSRFNGAKEETMRASGRVATTLNRRIELFITLPLTKPDRLMLQRQVADIGM